MADITAFRINGVIDTSKKCLDNLNAMCLASACWISFDVSSGLWKVIINRAGNSVFSFDNSNIIGSINVSGTGIDQLYNAVEVQYPLEDIGGTVDYSNQSLNETLWNPHETYKVLSIQSDLINNPVQAQYIGQVQLKQNRLDKIVTFSADYSALGLKAGDLIDLTVDMYGYNQKMFRIITIVENDDPNNGITLDITALEYDPDIYDQAGLTYTARTTATGITPIGANSAVQGANVASQTNLVYSFATSRFNATGVDISTSDVSFFGLDGSNNGDGSMQFYNLGTSYKLKYSGRFNLRYDVNWGSNFNYDNGVIHVPNTIRKNTYMTILKNGQRYDVDGSSSIKGSDPNADVAMSEIFTGVAGDVIQFYVGIASDLTNASPGTTTGPATNTSTITVTGNLYFVGA
jgi:hypothetical protein